MSSVADESVSPQTPLALTPEYGLWDRILIMRDHLIATKRFQRLAASLPIFRSISRSRASNLFDVMAGFVYSQILLACVRLNVFNYGKNLTSLFNHPYTNIYLHAQGMRGGLRLDPVAYNWSLCICGLCDPPMLEQISFLLI